MYAHCVWCAAALGRNETIEAFPIGRRLAFDQAKGRLWVVCPKCTRWNLTPVEERWDAMEACERLCRDTRKRVSTDHIGLAHVGDGVDLVRIGAPLLPEFAAWRYGSEFKRRYARSTVRQAGFAAVNGVFGFPGLDFLVGASIYDVWANSRMVGRLEHPGTGDSMPLTVLTARAVQFEFRDNTAMLAVPTQKGGHHAAKVDEDVFAVLERGGRIKRGWFDVGVAPDEWMVFSGEHAVEALSRTIPHVNFDGALGRDVKESVALIEQERDLRALWRAVGSTRLTRPLALRTPKVRLALEMLLHEADERRWLEGELADLEARWRDAEAIAAISDRLPDLPPAKPNG